MPTIDEIEALGKHVPALSGPRVTVFWYLLPALGDAVLMLASSMPTLAIRQNEGPGL
jgi:hypothetical protein